MTRKEAIAIVKENYPHVTSSGTQFESALRALIPELRESEDERIRKALYDEIKNWDASYRMFKTYSKESILAYLEKQKYDRMKPIYDARESFESALEKAWNDYHNGYENVDKLEDDYVECAHAKGFREGFLFGREKQKEQKPVEWSEEDKKMLNSIIDVVCGVGSQPNGLREKQVNFLKSLRPSWKPSEEQMMALHYASYGGELSPDELLLLDSLYNQLSELI